MTSGGRASRFFQEAFDDSRSLVTGALVFRWVWMLWMTGLAAISADELVRDWLVWTSLGSAIAWTMWLTFARRSWNQAVMVIDVAICAGLVLVSGLVVGEGEIVAGRPFFASGYPLSAPLLWGAVWGPVTGGVVASILAVCHLLSRPLNGVALSDLSPGQVQSMTGAMLNYLVAGIAVGLVARLLQRSADAVQRANEEIVKERELTARLAERESLGRAIHDSVLQTLSLVHKKGKELAQSRTVPTEDVERLAKLAGDQERELRALILRQPESPPSGRASLRDALEKATREISDAHASVSATGPIWMAQHVVDEVQAAVRQALQNVAQHASATRTTVFAEESGDEVSVSIRDDGIGFAYNEAELQRNGKVGILRSMKGRLEDLGGRMNVTSAPGAGTEIEFHVSRERDDV